MRRLAFALLFPLVSCSQPVALKVNDAWTRDTIGRTANAAVFMTIKSQSPDRLISVSTPMARKTDIMTMGGGGVMGMTYLKGIDIPANTPVSLNPSGLHIWLADLHEPLKAGQTFRLNLRFEKAGERQIEVSVIKPDSAPPNSGG